MHCVPVYPPSLGQALLHLLMLLQILPLISSCNNTESISGILPRWYCIMEIGNNDQTGICLYGFDILSVICVKDLS